MEYSGGHGRHVRPGQESPLIVMSLGRLTSHEISTSTLSSTGNDSSHDGGINDVLAVANADGGYNSLDFVVGVNYEGHEPFDTFSVSGAAAGTDSADWLVELHNGSGEWNLTTTFDMGLENVLNFSNLNVRVTPANQSTAHMFENGHTIALQIMGPEGYLAEHFITVRIPQIHGFELTEPMNEAYGIQSGQTLSIAIEFTNTGNGDEKFVFEFDDTELPEGWVRTGAITHTIGGFMSSTHTVTVVAPTNASVEDFTIYISIRDKANNTYPDFEIHVQTSMPVLSIVSHQLYSGGVDVVSGQTALYTVVVKNDGLIDAQMVQLNGTLCDNLGCTGLDGDEPYGTDMRDVPANSEVVFEIALDLSNTEPCTCYIQFELNASGFDSVEEYDSDQIKVRSPPIEKTSDWIGWLLGALLVVALLLLTRGGGRRRSAAPF